MDRLEQVKCMGQENEDLLRTVLPLLFLVIRKNVSDLGLSSVDFNS